LWKKLWKLLENSKKTRLKAFAKNGEKIYNRITMAKNEKEIVKLRNLKKRFGVGDAENYALNGVNLSIKQGEFIIIMGPSGCGKTTLLNTIGLLDRATEGDYVLDGQNVARMSRRNQAKIRSEKIGFIFQNFNLISRLTVIENVALPLVYKGIGKVKRLEKASEVLKQFHLGEREFYMPWQLSGGQTQRVAIARALVNKPSIILADEPTGNLDSKSSHIIMEELAEVHKKGNTIIMVTHNPDLMAYATRIITMFDGKIDTDVKKKPAKKSSKKDEKLNTLDKIEKVEEKIDEIKEELGV
jgi:ABC transporter-related protein